MRSDELKKLAGEAAARHVKSGMVVGLGTGSTVYYTIMKLGEMVRSGALDIVGIATSVATENLALENGIPLGALDDYPVIDLTIDGADEIDPRLNLIKGMGGALLREKVVASVSRKLIIVADASKVVDALGTRSPLPVEVFPFAVGPVRRKLEGMCKAVKLRERDGKIFVSDNGNYILDCRFDRIDDPVELEAELNNTPGVAENGLFLGLAHRAYVGTTDGIRTIG